MTDHADEVAREGIAQLGMLRTEYIPAVSDAALAALEDAGYRIVLNGEHLLHQDLEHGRWWMEHTVDCRQAGLSNCQLGRLAADGAWEDLDDGKYRMDWNDGEPTVTVVDSGG